LGERDTQGGGKVTDRGGIRAGILAIVTVTQIGKTG
jgi:hypothetical protein